MIGPGVRRGIPSGFFRPAGIFSLPWPGAACRGVEKGNCGGSCASQFHFFPGKCGAGCET